MSEERRLAAIMFTDMVGYTALMGRDESLARELVERARARIRSQVERFHGQWLDEAGDGTLSAFPSAVEAVDCGLAIQEALRDDPEIRIRIGIHLGDVVFTGGRVYGDGVNVASRIEGLASPGGIAVSDAVASAIRGHRPAAMSYLGRKRLKNVDEPVRVYALAPKWQRGARPLGFLRVLWHRRVPQVMCLYALAGVTLVLLARWLAARYGLPGRWVLAVAAALVTLTPAVAAGAFFRADPGSGRRAGEEERRWRPGRMAITLNVVAMLVVAGIVVQDAPLPGEPVASIAVLPFDNLSDDPANEYFSDGLTDELISTLARIDAVNVAARTSSFMFKGSRKDVQEIGKALNVRYVLDGSVRKSDDRLRVSVQLVDARSGYNVWQESYDKTLNDIFSVQEDIARAVVSRLDVILPTEQSARLAHVPTESLEAYNFYLQGLDYLHRPATERNLSLADNLFRNAVTLDPGYAGAYSGLCRVSLQRYELTNAPRYIDSGETACMTAMELDSGLQGVRIALGHLYRRTDRLERAEELFREVIESSPRQADAWVGLGQTLERRGNRDAEAERALRRAVELQPADWRTHMALGEFLYWQNRYAEAEPVFERAVELTPNNSRALEFIGSAYLLYGRIEDGMEVNRRAIEIAPSRSAYRNLGLGHLYLGEYEQAISMYRKGIGLEREDHWIWGELGDALRHSGREEEAREAYETAAALAQSVLDHGDRKPKVMARLALYLINVGREEEAIAYYRESLELAGDEPEVLYYAAQLDQIRGQPQAALDKLEKAVEGGFSAAIIAPLPDFESLRASGRFQRLVAQET